MSATSKVVVSQVIDLCGDSDGDETPVTAAAAAVAKPGNKKRPREESSTASAARQPAGPLNTANGSHAAALSNGTATYETPGMVVEPLIFFSGSEDLEITEGLLSKLQLPALDIVTCIAPGQSSTTTTLRHIRQKDKWSCGFRNLQMMLTALLPMLPNGHDYLVNSPNEAGAFFIPSLLELQKLLEELWKAGWDQDGAKHYKSRMVGKKAWIGAVEVSSAMAYQGIDNTIVQFIKCAESRTQLGAFCWAYFERAAGCGGCRRGGSCGCQSVGLAQQLLSIVAAAAAAASGSKVPVATKEAKEVSCQCVVPPLYLQWKGHSVTVVGVERQAAGDMNLLLFDPVVAGPKLEQALVRGDVAPMRLVCKKLQAKDCQVIMCSPRPLTIYEKDERKQEVSAVTAAQEAVAKLMQR